MIEAAKRSGRAVSVGLIGNAAPIREIADRGVVPDVVTDQTSAHDPINGYLPSGWSVEEWIERTARRSRGHPGGRQALHGGASPRDLALRAKGAVAVDYGNNIRAMAREAGVADAFSYPGFLPRPTCGRCFASARGRFGGLRCQAIQTTSFAPMTRCANSFPTNPSLNSWLEKARAHVRFQACRHASAGSASASAIAWVLRSMNGRARRGFGADRDRARSYLDFGSVASPIARPRA